MHDFAFFSLRMGKDLPGLIGIEGLCWRPGGEVVVESIQSERS